MSRPMRRPYDNIRAVIEAAEKAAAKGCRYEPKERPPVIIGPVEPKPKIEPRPRVLPPGAVIAQQLLDSDDPMGVQVTATDFITKELHAHQQSGTRHLKRTGKGHLRLSFRRHGDEVVFFLTEKS